MGALASTCEHSAQERILFGKPMAGTLDEEFGCKPAERVFVIATRNLNRKTDVVIPPS